MVHNSTSSGPGASFHASHNTFAKRHTHRYGSAVKNPRPMQEMWVQSLGWEDSLEEEMAAHSSILAWEIPWTRGT